MNCNEAWKDISKYLDGDLSAEVKRMLDEHVGGCDHCKVVFDTARKTIELYCNGKLFPMPDLVRGRLHDILRRKFREKIV